MVVMVQSLVHQVNLLGGCRRRDLVLDRCDLLRHSLLKLLLLFVEIVLRGRELTLFAACTWQDCIRDLLARLF